MAAASRFLRGKGHSTGVSDLCQAATQWLKAGVKSLLRYATRPHIFLKRTPSPGAVPLTLPLAPSLIDCSQEPLLRYLPLDRQSGVHGGVTGIPATSGGG
ncbi:hypothetical protein NOVOSPHI9U_150013 [Novosphingobium sp. 9U]|nr:hypothetical protein NOVOSPHI9U_150013 [Novosphingobium sp. 9U]